MFGGYEAVAGFVEASKTTVVGHGAVSQAAAALASAMPTAHTTKTSYHLQTDCLLRFLSFGFHNFFLERSVTSPVVDVSRSGAVYF